MRAPTIDGQRWSNAAADRIGLSAPDPRWPARFAKEEAVIRSALDAGPEFRIEHFGSTAIPGLAAKPIIDIMLIPPPGENWRRLIGPLG